MRAAGAVAHLNLTSSPTTHAVGVCPSLQPPPTAARAAALQRHHCHLQRLQRAPQPAASGVHALQQHRHHPPRPHLHLVSSSTRAEAQRMCMGPPCHVCTPRWRERLQLLCWCHSPPHEARMITAARDHARRLAHNLRARPRELELSLPRARQTLSPVAPQQAGLGARTPRSGGNHTACLSSRDLHPPYTAKNKTRK